MHWQRNVSHDKEWSFRGVTGYGSERPQTRSRSFTCYWYFLTRFYVQVAVLGTEHPEGRHKGGLMSGLQGETKGGFTHADKEEHNVYITRHAASLFVES